mmetsp:Transcript_9880/g.28008  ORF Transcript_9880/g.28008 Transcript_9880/m.28008 type:complete len:93 (+) Transcript_9880:153-431(+)
MSAFIHSSIHPSIHLYLLPIQTFANDLSSPSHSRLLCPLVLPPSCPHPVSAHHECMMNQQNKKRRFTPSSMKSFWNCSISPLCGKSGFSLPS